MGFLAPSCFLVIFDYATPMHSVPNPTLQLASALRNQHMGFFLVAATSCWKLKSS
jgi:hypothetical protein